MRPFLFGLQPTYRKVQILEEYLNKDVQDPDLETLVGENGAILSFVRAMAAESGWT